MDENIKDLLPEEPLPVNLEIAVAELRKIQDDLDRLDTQKTALEAAKEEYRKMISEQMQLQGVTKFSTAHGTIFGKTKKYNQIKDFSVLQDWVIQTGHLEIFQRRLNNGAIEEIGESVPGVEAYEKFEITFRRK